MVDFHHAHLQSKIVILKPTFSKIFHGIWNICSNHNKIAIFFEAVQNKIGFIWIAVGEWAQIPSEFSWYFQVFLRLIANEGMKMSYGSLSHKQQIIPAAMSKYTTTTTKNAQ